MGRVRSLRLGLLASGLGLLAALGGLLLLVACGGTPAPPPPVIANFTATRSPITAGTSTTLVATFTNGAGTIDQDVGAVASGAPVSVTPVADTTYILTVINTAGMVAKSSTRVTLVPAPVATSLWATMNPELYGGSTTITPTFSAGTGSVDQGVGVVTNGVPFSSGPITAAKTFTLTVTNSLGTTATKSLTLTPVGVSLGAISPGSPTVTTGTTKTFSVLVSGGATNTVTWSATAGTITSGGVWTAPATVGTATITATSSDDPSAKTTTTVTTVAAPVATSLVASTQTPAYGTTFTLTPTYANGTGTLSNTVACPPTGVASGAITANWSGARTYTLTVTNAAGTTATATTAVTPQTVAVAAFTAGAPTVTVGATQAFSTTATGGATNALVWSSTGGTWSGSTWTAPATPGTYTITATSSDDTSKTAATTVTVVAAPAISSFSAAQSTLTAGASTTLTAVFANGTGAVNNSVGTVTTATAKPVTPASTTTYTLTVTNAAGSTAVATCTVTVVPAPVATSLTAGAATITAGSSTTLTPVFTNGTGAVDNSVGTVTTATAKTVTPAATTTYTLTVTNAAGSTAVATCTVTVVPAPVATSLTAGAATITAGSSTTLTPVFTNGTGAVDNSVGTVTTATAKTVTPARTTTYTLTVTNAAGSTAVATCTVTVVPAPVATSLTAGAATITAGASTTLTPVFTNGTGAVDHSVGTVVTTVAKTVTPAATTTYTLTVTNTAGTATTLQTTVTVVPAPRAQAIEMSVSSLAFGSTFTLTPYYINGTGSFDQGVTCPASGLPTAPITANWSGTRYYTLTVTNAAGDTDSSLRMPVTPQTVAFTGITPATPSVTAGYTQAFTATVTGGVTNTVTWDSSGQGTWSGNTWTAPATAGTATITATSVDDPTKTFGVTAAVVAPVPISGNLSAPEGPAATIRSPKLGSQEESLASASFAIPTALPPMGAGITINLIQIDNAGLQVGAVIATCLTDASGNYSLQAPAGFVPGPSHAVQALIPANGSTPAFTLLSFVTSTTANNIDPYTHATVGLVTASMTTGGGTLSSLGNGSVLEIQGTVYSNMGNVPNSATSTAAVLAALNTAMTKDDEANNTVVSLAYSTYITGHVYSGAGTSTPLGGIGVGVCTYSGFVLMGVTRTDALGYFKVNVPPGDYVVGAMNTTTTSFAASGWWTTGGVAVLSQFKAGKVTVPSSSLATADFHLVEGGRLLGTLTGNATPTDVPLPGMTVAISDFGSGQTLMSADTGPNGSFVFNVPAGTYSASVRNKTRYVPYGSANKMDSPPAGTGGGRNITQASKITVVAGVALPPGDMKLYQGSLISGQVKTGPSGTAVVGIPVRFQDANATQTINSVVGPGGSGAGAESVRTVKDGNYRLWVQPGHYHILSRGQTLINQDAGNANLPNMDFTTAMGKITMKLVDSAGNPLGQVRGDLYDTSGATGLSQEISNSEGILELYTTPGTNVKLGFSINTGEFFGSSVYSGSGAVASVAIRNGANIPSPVADITVGVGILPNNTITLPDGATLSGFVTTNPHSVSPPATPATPVGWPNALVQVRMEGDADGTYKLANIRTRSDGFFTVTLPAGLTVYKLRAFPPTSNNPAWGSSSINTVTMGVKGTTLDPNIRFNWIFGAALVPASSHVASGSSTTLTPTFPSGTTAVIGNNGNDSSQLGAATSGTGVSTGNLSATKTFTLSVTDASGDKSYYTCTVNVP